MWALSDLIAQVHRDVHERESHISFMEIKRRSMKAPDAIDPLPFLRESTTGATSIIGEIKRLSPVKGSLADIPEPGVLAKTYEDNGAAMISVLAEHHHHGARKTDLEDVVCAVDIPVLMKNLVLTPYQVHEARAQGADAVLLIAAALEQPALIALLDRIHSIGMKALVGTNSRLDALRALDAGAEFISVNARSYTTMTVDRNVIDQVIDVIPSNVVAVAEATVACPRDVAEFACWGADAVIVGEALVTADDPGALMKQMVAAGCHPALHRDRRERVRRARNVGYS